MDLPTIIVVVAYLMADATDHVHQVFVRVHFLLGEEFEYRDRLAVDPNISPTVETFAAKAPGALATG